MLGHCPAIECEEASGVTPESMITEKEVLGFKPTTRLEQIGDEPPEGINDGKHRR